jgi:hypothetical protein
VITSVFERDSVRYDVEQFAYPLNGAPGERRGDIPMVLLQKVRATDLSGKARVIPVTMSPPPVSSVCSHRHMASAFSHSAFEPVEHRWTHGQYFGPPSCVGSRNWPGNSDNRHDGTRADDDPIWICGLGPNFHIIQLLPCL